jgi:predicted amidohydrolase
MAENINVPVKMGNQVKVGAVQAEPAWLDLKGGVAKTISLIKKARAEGINVLGSPGLFYSKLSMACVLLS